MQSKINVLESFTRIQREEFDADIQYLIERTALEYDFDSTKVAEVNTNMRLRDEVYLNVTILFHCSNEGKVTASVERLYRFNTLDDYLDSISKTNSDDRGKTIK